MKLVFRYSRTTIGVQILNYAHNHNFLTETTAACWRLVYTKLLISERRSRMDFQIVKLILLIIRLSSGFNASKEKAISRQFLYHVMQMMHKKNLFNNLLIKTRRSIELLNLCRFCTFYF
uniref:Uncharacterized protein n=1 Tax=Pararge aegeria TaxID=116150 RepID=S4P8J3_9NEOP